MHFSKLTLTELFNKMLNKILQKYFVLKELRYPRYPKRKVKLNAVIYRLVFYIM